MSKGGCSFAELLELVFFPLSVGVAVDCIRSRRRPSTGVARTSPSRSGQVTVPPLARAPPRYSMSLDDLRRTPAAAPALVNKATLIGGRYRLTGLVLGTGTWGEVSKFPPSLPRRQATNSLAHLFVLFPSPCYP